MAEGHGFPNEVHCLLLPNENLPCAGNQRRRPTSVDGTVEHGLMLLGKILNILQ